MAKNFIDFVIAASKGVKLGKDFKAILETATPAELKKWFAKKGYDVSAADAEKIIKNRKNILKLKESIVEFSY